jgi:hypothetical protein
VQLRRSNHWFGLRLGNVHLTNNCRISGDVYAGGSLTMDSTPQVLGSVSAVGNVRF